MPTVTLDFDGLNPASSFEDWLYYHVIISEDGFNLNNIIMTDIKFLEFRELATARWGYSYNGPGVLALAGATEIKRDSAEPFSLLSIQLDTGSATSGHFLRVSAEKGSGFITTTLSLDASAGLQTFFLPPEFTGLLGVTLESSGTNVQFDNIVLALESTPIALPDSFEGDEGELITGNVLINDSDADGHQLTAELVAGPRHGVVAWNSDGTFTYRTHDTDFNGTDSFSYVASDGATSSAPQAVSLIINPVNDAPVGQVTIIGMPIEGELLTAEGISFHDVDGIVEVDFQWLRNGVEIAGATALSYRLGQADVGASISVVAKYIDGGGTLESVGSAPTAPIAEVNEPPSAENQLITREEGAARLEITLGASDPDGDELTFILEGLGGGRLYSAPFGGTLLFKDGDAIGTTLPPVVYFEPNSENFNGLHRLRFSASDGALKSSLATVVIRTTPVNDPVTGTLTIGGAAVEGEQLSAVNNLDDADGFLEVTYQWQRNGIDIEGATASTYRLAGADVGAVISVVASFIDGGGTLESVVSAPTTPVSDVNAVPVAVDEGEPFIARSDDFLVNTATLGQQLQPSVAPLASGGFVVSWTDDSGAGADASFAGIKAQIFDASGAALGPEFSVNSTTFLKQESPSVAALPSGGFVVAWTDQDAEIKAQLFGAGGDKVGSELLVSSAAAIGRILPATASLVSGGFVVTWVAVSDEGEGTSAHSVKAQIFEADGTKTGAEFLVNTTTLSTQYGPTVTSLPSGGFVVSWFDNSGIGGDATGYAIKGQIFDAAGRKSGAEFLVNTEAAGDQLNPTITSLASGGFVVSWADAGGSDGSGYGIKAQIFDQDGSKVGTEFLVNTVTAADQLSPKVSPLASGGFVITWVDDSGEGGDGDSHGIKARIFDDAGRKIGSEFLINLTTAGLQDAPTITELASGALVAAWSDTSGLGGDDSPSGIKARIFDPSSSIIVTSEDVSLIIVPVTLNDSDADGDSLTVTSVDVLRDGLGTAVADDIGDVRYAPLVYNYLGPNESSVVQIGYTISDGRGGTDDAVITVTVLGANDTPTGVATISGTAIESEVLIASNDLVDPEGVGEVSYQWNRDGLAIVGAASSTYVLTAADVGAAISVTARYTDGGGTLESVTSEATARILSAPRTFTFTGNNNANTFIAPDDANWIVNGFGGSDSLTTRAGRDQVSGGAGNDTIDTGANDDVVYFTGTNGGFDFVTGGLGSDRIQATSNGTVIGLAALAGVELVASGGFTGVSIAGSAAANSLDFRSITLTGIERINAGGGVDTVLGSAGGDVIVGGAGNDVLSGGGGDDLFEVGLSAGTDRYDGGEGYDRIVALGPNVTIGLGALAGIEAISGGAFANVLIQGTSAADQLDFSDIVLSGILSINAAGGNDAITGSQGGDTIIGGGGDDVIDSLGGSDILIDGSGAGRLIGGTGDDNLTGDGGEDILEGGEDADRLTGGAGRDQLLGGGENDIFAYLATTDSRSANNRDTILDFQQGLDLIDLSVIDASSLVAGNNAFTFIGEAAFSRRAGQLHYRNIGADTVLEGDVDGDSRADFQVLIIGSVEIQAGDLLI